MSEQWIRQAWRQAREPAAPLAAADEGRIAAAVLGDGDGDDRADGLGRLAQSDDAAAIARVLMAVRGDAEAVASAVTARPAPATQPARRAVPRWPLWGLAASLAVAVSLYWPRESQAPAELAEKNVAPATLLDSSFEEEAATAQQDDDRMFAAGFDS